MGLFCSAMISDVMRSTSVDVAFPASPSAFARYLCAAAYGVVSTCAWMVLRDVRNEYSHVVRAGVAGSRRGTRRRVHAVAARRVPLQRAVTVAEQPALPSTMAAWGLRRPLPPHRSPL